MATLAERVVVTVNQEKESYAFKVGNKYIPVLKIENGTEISGSDLHVHVGVEGNVHKIYMNRLVLADYFTSKLELQTENGEKLVLYSTATLDDNDILTGGFDILTQFGPLDIDVFSDILRVRSVFGPIYAKFAGLTVKVSNTSVTATRIVLRTASGFCITLPKDLITVGIMNGRLLVSFKHYTLELGIGEVETSLVMPTATVNNVNIELADLLDSYKRERPTTRSTNDMSLLEAESSYVKPNLYAVVGDWILPISKFKYSFNNGKGKFRLLLEDNCFIEYVSHENNMLFENSEEGTFIISSYAKFGKLTEIIRVKIGTL